MTAEDLKKVVTFINNIESMGFDLSGFTKLLNVIGKLTVLVPGLENVFDLQLPTLDTPNVTSDEASSL
jgi:hypothetical protein